MKNKDLYLWLVTALLTLVGCSNNDEGTGETSSIDIIPEERSLLVEGRKWCIGTCIQWPVYGEVIAYTTACVESSFDFNGKKYKRIRSTLLANPEIGVNEDIIKYLSPMCEEDGRIYVLDTVSLKENLDFDCNMKVGDKDPQGYTITEIIFRKTSSESDTLRRCFIMNVKDPYTPEPGYTREYIEGIGYVDGAFLHDPLTTGGFFKLICCHEADGKCIYGETGHDCKFSKSSK